MRLARFQDGRAWLERLPTLVDAAQAKWRLTMGDPYPDAQESLVVPASRPNGDDVVLKIRFPGRENEFEADALERWRGDGAVLLIDRDDDLGAMLVERSEPGTPLSVEGQRRALDVFVELLPRLWQRASPPFRTLADEASWWAGYLEAEHERAGRPFDRSLLDVALDALDELPPTQGPGVLLHQDLHGDNVLRAERQPWLVIDPKPLIGEREFGVAPIVRSFELGTAREDVLHRLDRLTSDLGLDRERARRWTIAQTVAWCFDDGRALPWHLSVATWLAERRRR